MHAVLNALLTERRRLFPEVIFESETGPDLTQYALRSKLDLEIQGSATSSQVPFRLTEEITMQAAGDPCRLAIPDRMARPPAQGGLHGRTWGADDAHISLHYMTGYTTDKPGEGGSRQVTITWEGLASW